MRGSWGTSWINHQGRAKTNKPTTFRPKDNLGCLWTGWGSQRAWRQAREEHANPTKKSPWPPGSFKPRTFVLWGPLSSQCSKTVSCLSAPCCRLTQWAHTCSTRLMQCGSVHPEAACDIVQHLTRLWWSNCVRVQVVLSTFFHVGGSKMRLHWLAGVASDAHTHSRHCYYIFKCICYVGITMATVILPWRVWEVMFLLLTALLLVLPLVRSSKQLKSVFTYVQFSCFEYCNRGTGRVQTWSYVSQKEKSQMSWPAKFLSSCRLTDLSGSLTDGPVNYKYKTKCTWLIEG